MGGMEGNDSERDSATASPAGCVDAVLVMQPAPKLSQLRRVIFCLAIRESRYDTLSEASWVVSIIEQG